MAVAALALAIGLPSFAIRAQEGGTMLATPVSAPNPSVSSPRPSAEDLAGLKTPEGRTQFVQKYCAGCHDA